MAENTLSGQPGELRAIIHITRKATGQVETYELVGKPIPIPEEQEAKNVSNP